MDRGNGMRSTMVRRARKILHFKAVSEPGFRAVTHGLVFKFLAGLACLFVASPAATNETLSYTYDAAGRLVKATHSGTINNGTNACYSYDRADNRTNVTVSTPSDCSPLPPVSFSINDVSVTEGGNLVFTITKTGTASGTLSVDYATSDGTASGGADYTAATGTLSFLATDTSKIITIPTSDDIAIESAETLLLNLANASTGSTIGDGQGVGTITDNDSDCLGVSFTVASNGAVTEGANSTFTITKSGSSSFLCTVNYATASGTGPQGALSGTDFTPTSSALTFAPGQTSLTVSVPTADDSTYEFPETFTMALSAPNKSGALGSPSSATATINDNDACSGVAFTIASNGPMTEGSNAVFTVSKTAAAAGTCSVDYSTSNGSAVAPGDYTAASGTLTFTAGQSSQLLSIPTVDDTTPESPETFTATLSNATLGAAVGSPGTAIGTINDNDSGGTCIGVSYSVNDVATVEGSNLVFTVTKAGSTAANCSVNFATANSTAVAPTDYAAVSGTLTFAPSQATLTVSVSTVDHSRLTGSKKMFLNLSTASDGAGISDSQGIGSITAGGGSGCRTCL